MSIDIKLNGLNALNPFAKLDDISYIFLHLKDGFENVGAQESGDNNIEEKVYNFTFPSVWVQPLEEKKVIGTVEYFIDKTYGLLNIVNDNQEKLSGILEKYTTDVLAASVIYYAFKEMNDNVRFIDATNVLAHMFSAAMVVFGRDAKGFIAVSDYAVLLECFTTALQAKRPQEEEKKESIVSVGDMHSGNTGRHRKRLKAADPRAWLAIPAYGQSFGDTTTTSTENSWQERALYNKQADKGCCVVM